MRGRKLSMCGCYENGSKRKTLTNVHEVFLENIVDITKHVNRNKLGYNLETDMGISLWLYEK